MKQILKYFWKFLGITFLIEILWYIICFSIGFFYFPDLMRHISMIGFLVIPFITSYHTMWKQIDELESFIEAQYTEIHKEITKPAKVKKNKKKNNNKLKKSIIVIKDDEVKNMDTEINLKEPSILYDENEEEETF